MPFAAYVPDGDLARYARGLSQALHRDFVGTMALLKNPDFQTLLVTYPRPERSFLKAIEQTDNVSSVPSSETWRAPNTSPKTT